MNTVSYQEMLAEQVSSKNFLSVSPGTKISSVLETVKNQVGRVESVNYIYVVENTSLVGVFSIKELFKARAEQSVEDIATPDLVYVSAKDSLEFAAHTAVNNSIKMIPVLNKGKLMGVIDTDTIFRVLRNEATEDLMATAGIFPEQQADVFLWDTSIFSHFKQRIPWLLIGLCGGVLAAFVVGAYEDTLESHLAIAAFIPLVVYLADALASQIQVLYIRKITLDPATNFFYYARRELFVNLLLGLTLASVVSFLSFGIYTDILVSLVLGLSVFATAIIAAIVALLFPMILNKLGKDPALGSGPIATVCIDIISLLVYFYIASVFIL